MTAADLVVVAAMRGEAAALGRALPGRVLRSGVGGRSARRLVADRRLGAARAVAVAGIAGGVAGDLRTGDVVVASEVRSDAGVLRCPSAPVLAGALRRSGIGASVGPIGTARGLVTGSRRRRYGVAGVLCVDMESADVLMAAPDVPRAVVRVIADEAGRGLLRPDTLGRVRRATRVLERLGPALAGWAAAAGERTVLTEPDAALAADLVLLIGPAGAPPVLPTGSGRVEVIRDAADVRPEWLVGARTVGVLAGWALTGLALTGSMLPGLALTGGDVTGDPASADAVEQVVTALSGFGHASADRNGTEKSIPKEVCGS